MQVKSNNFVFICRCPEYNYNANTETSNYNINNNKAKVTIDYIQTYLDTFDCAKQYQDKSNCIEEFYADMLINAEQANIFVVFADNNFIKNASDNTSFESIQLSLVDEILQTVSEDETRKVIYVLSHNGNSNTNKQYIKSHINTKLLISNMVTFIEEDMSQNITDEILLELGLSDNLCLPTDKDNGYVFISYDRNNHLEMLKVSKLLKNNGTDIWWDKGIPYGQPYKNVIKDKITNCSVIYMLFSSEVLKSGYHSGVFDEYILAKNLNKKVNLICINDIYDNARKLLSNDDYISSEQDVNKKIYMKNFLSEVLKNNNLNYYDELFDQKLIENVSN